MKTTKYLLVVIAFFVFITTYAQDGTLDTTFDGDGIVLPNYGNLESENLFLKVQPDGKIITAETVSEHGANPQYYLRRYTASGVQDSSFGAGGTTISDFVGFTARVNGIGLKADGKIIVVGLLIGAGGGPFIARYDITGELDLDFGIGGIMTIGDDFLHAFALQSDGKILVAHSFFGATRKLSRYNDNGILDTEFGVDGNVDITSLEKINVQDDGKILLLGGDQDFVITRYLSNGTVDLAFGADGTVIFNIQDFDHIKSVRTQADGKILFVGQSGNTGLPATTYNLIRLSSSGALDASFGTFGMVSLPVASDVVEFQADGKIIVAGSFPLEDGPNQLALSRFLTNGDLDMSFGINGLVSSFLGASVRVSPSELETTTNGKIIVGGTFCEAFLSCHPRSFVARYSATQLSASDFNFNKNAFTVYPNPVNQIVNIDFNLTQSEVLSIDLFDINGRKISNLLNNGNFATGYNSQKLELPGSLSNGIYFLNISDGKSTSTVKIVK